MAVFEAVVGMTQQMHPENLAPPWFDGRATPDLARAILSAIRSHCDSAPSCSGATSSVFSGGTAPLAAFLPERPRDYARADKLPLVPERVPSCPILSRAVAHSPVSSCADVGHGEPTLRHRWAWTPRRYVYVRCRERSYHQTCWPDSIVKMRSRRLEPSATSQ